VWHRMGRRCSGSDGAVSVVAVGPCLKLRRGWTGRNETGWAREAPPDARRRARPGRPRPCEKGECGSHRWWRRSRTSRRTERLATCRLAAARRRFYSLPATHETRQPPQEAK
jgi:hypothetical protein